MPRRDLLQLRRGTAAQWATANPTLAAAEAGFETDTGNLKYGDGSTSWNSLDYFAPEGVIDPDTTLLGNPITAAELDTLSGIDSNVQDQLDTKAANGHAHIIADVTSLQGALDAKAASSHTHEIADTTGLQSALNAKADDSEITTLTDTKLAKAGDTMTGLLTLSGAPSSALHAATKAYVDSVGAGLPAGIYLGSVYGTSGSIVTTTGSINASSNQLTVASASSFAVGHGIYIAGAGAAGVPLITSVFGIAGNVLTLVDNASTTVSSVLVQHDESAALNEIMDVVVGAGGGEIWLEPGFYRVNGPFLASDSILAPPYIPVSGDSPLGLTIRGLAPVPWQSFDGPQSSGGVIIQSDKVLATAQSSIFAASVWVPGTDWSVFNNLSIYMQDLIFRTYDNPNLNALDLGMSGGAHVKHVFVDTGMQVQVGAEPTHGTFGIRMPRANAAIGFMRCEYAWAMHYDTGFIVAESNGQNALLALRCKTAVQMGFNFHPIVAYVATWQCPTVAAFSDRAIIDWNMTIENAPDGSWYSPISGRHVYDATDQLHGVVRYSSIRSETGADVAISNTGATAVVFTNLRA